MKTLAPTDRKELRQFGLGLGVLIVAVFWAAVPWLWDRPRPGWPLLVGPLIAGLALAWPRAIHPLHRVLLPVARVLGMINTWLLLGAVFFGILFPVGWVLRRMGRLQYVTRIDADAASYRTDVDPAHAVRLEEPF